MTNLDSMLKSRDYFANKGSSSQGYGFSSGPTPRQCRALLPSLERASLSASCPGSLPPSGSFPHLPKCWPVARLPFPGVPVTSEPQVRWAATWHPGGLATGLIFRACARHGGAGARAGNRCGQEGCVSGGAAEAKPAGRGDAEGAGQVDRRPLTLAEALAGVGGPARG